jgi:hypothetical protein
MFLFKASGATYRAVLRQRVHAFPKSPREVNGDELVLLSKNKEDCEQLERQVQHLAKLRRVRRATREELDRWFPNVRASERWQYAVELYLVQVLDKPFNLRNVPGINAKHYNTVQAFATLSESEELSLTEYLCKTNPRVVAAFLNADRPDDD